MPMAQMQWWYFDFLLRDGSVLVVGFSPKKWWRDHEEASREEPFFRASLLTSDGKVHSFNKSFPPGSLASSKGRVEIPGQLSISYEQGQYRLQFNMEGFQGLLKVTDISRPFSPLPFGRIPGWIRSLFFKAPKGVPDFTYAAQVPRGKVSGSIAFQSHPARAEGWAYHEQGRFDALPEHLSQGWFWFHFLHPEWNLFGTPEFISVQEKEKVHFSGLSLFDPHYEVKNRVFDSKNPKILCGCEIHFTHKKKKFRIDAFPETAVPLISCPSIYSQQLWTTLSVASELKIGSDGEMKTYAGKILLETSSLATDG